MKHISKKDYFFSSIFKHMLNFLIKFSDEAAQRANEVLRARELALSKKNMASRIENEQAVNSIL